MTESRSEAAGAEECWPSFALRYTFSPEDLVERDGFDPDELVVYDPGSTGGHSGAWLAAKRGSYVSIEDTR